MRRRAPTPNLVGRRAIRRPRMSQAEIEGLATGIPPAKGRGYVLKKEPQGSYSIVNPLIKKRAR